MFHRLTTLFGKTIQYIARLRGGGSALPGLLVEKINPNFAQKTLTQLPCGVVIISGTNGKTTTTKMVVELLEGQGLKVFTNKTGSNFVRGVIAALIDQTTIHGKLDADIAVLELDEAHAVHFVQTIKPDYSLLLNVMRDQLDRFGEIDTTARMLETIAKSTREHVVLNREDPRIARIGNHITTAKSYYGLSKKLQQLFPSDDAMRNTQQPRKIEQIPATVTLESIDENSGVFTINNQSYTTTLKLKGLYNIANAAAAAALCVAILQKNIDTTRLIESLSNVTPAFGRGESVSIGGRTVELILVKNPAGFRLSLASFSPKDTATMIAINDNYADGRDMSWLWDVDFESLAKNGVHTVSGVRAYDMALRLQYDEIGIEHVIPELTNALSTFLTQTKDQNGRIYCTYTAMLAIRQQLAKHAKMEKVL